MPRREVIAKCQELGIPIFQGRIDKTLFINVLRSKGNEPVQSTASSQPLDGEWVLVSGDRLAVDWELKLAIERFRPPRHPAADRAAAWLLNDGLAQAGLVATYVYMSHLGEIEGFYAIRMSEAELRQKDRKRLGATHPSQGAILIVWMCKAAGGRLTGQELLLHAVGTARIAAKTAGAAMIALDAFDAEVDRMWRERFGFRRSSTALPGERGEAGLRRLWIPIFGGC
jgi:hypothetical protein